MATATSAYCVLLLTKDETDTLLAVLNEVGGSPTHSRRKHTDAIMKAIDETGYVGYDTPKDLTYKEAVGLMGLYFTDSL